MIEIMPESTDSMVAVKASGKLTHNDYATVWIPALKKGIEAHGKIDGLLYMDEDFEGWELEAMWDDTKFGFSHRNDFRRLAVVGGPKWVAWGAKLAALITDGEIKTFERSQLAEAISWVKGE